LRGQPRRTAAARVADRMKLHRRRLRLDGRDYTVVTLRPGTDARLSTNYFHGTWHILSDWHGARLLGRLLWGLAYQRVPGTLVLIDRPSLDPNPFDAEPADPVALVPALLTPLGSAAARDLRRQLPLHRPTDGTVRWHTPGYDAAVAERRARQDRSPGEWREPYVEPVGFQERVDRVGGLVTLAAVPRVLKEYATSIGTLGDWSSDGMSYAEVDWPHGEVQVFRDYRRRVSAAQIARQEVLNEHPRPPAPDTLRPLIWSRSTAVRHRGRGPSLPPPAPATDPGSTRPTATPYGRAVPLRLPTVLGGRDDSCPAGTPVERNPSATEPHRTSRSYG
jgi:hypothetical protein